MFGGSGFARGQSGAEGGDARSCGSKVKEKERGEERGREREKEKKKEKKRYYERRNGRPRTLLHLVKLQSFLGYIRDTRCAW